MDLVDGPVRLDGVFGSTTWRLPDIAVAVPAAGSTSTAFAVTGGRRGSVWHRLDLDTGEVAESRALGVVTARPTDVRADGRRVLFTGTDGDPTLRVRTHEDRFLFRVGGGWKVARFVPGEPRIVGYTAQGWLNEIDADTGAEVYRLRCAGYPSVAGDLVSFQLDRDHFTLVERSTRRTVGRWVAKATASLPSMRPGELFTVDAGTLHCWTADKRHPQWSGPTAPWRSTIVQILRRPDGRTVLVTSGGWAYEHSTVDGTVLSRHELGGGALRFDGDARRAVCWNRGVFWHWDGTADHRRSWGHEAPVVNVAASPDGRYVATHAEDGTVRVWDAPDSAERHVLRVAHGPDTTLGFSPDGRLVTAAGNRHARTWDVGSGAETPVPYPFPDDVVASWRLSPDGTLFYAVTRRDGLRLEGTLVRLADGARLWHGPVEDAAAGFDADGLLVPTRTGLTRPDADPIPLPRAKSTRRIGFSPDGARIAVVTMGGSALRDTRTRRLLARTTITTNHPPLFIGSRWLVLIDFSHRIRVLDLPKLRHRATVTLAARDDLPIALAASPDSAFLVGTRIGLILRFTLDA